MKHIVTSGNNILKFNDNEVMEIEVSEPVGFPLLWLKYDDVTLAGSGVTQWNDKSGNGHHATQASASLQPVLSNDVINGRPALVFDNTKELTGVKLPNFHNNDFTFFIVLRTANVPSSSNYDVIFSYRAGTTTNMFSTAWYTQEGIGQMESINIWAGGSAGLSSGNKSFPIDEPRNGIISLTRHGFDLKSYLNGNLTDFGTMINDIADGTYFISNAISLGESSRFRGFISEIIIFPEYLDESRRGSVENYLSAHYGIL